MSIPRHMTMQCLIKGCSVVLCLRFLFGGKFTSDISYPYSFKNLSILIEYISQVSVLLPSDDAVSDFVSFGATGLRRPSIPEDVNRNLILKKVNK